MFFGEPSFVVGVRYQKQIYRPSMDSGCGPGAAPVSLCFGDPRRAALHFWSIVFVLPRLRARCAPIWILAKIDFFTTFLLGWAEARFPGAQPRTRPYGTRQSILLTKEMLFDYSIPPPKVLSAWRSNLLQTSLFYTEFLLLQMKETKIRV